MDDNLSDLKICVQMPLPHEKDIHKKLRNSSTSDLQHQKLQAAFYTSKLWPKHSTIKVGFLPLGENQRMAVWTNLDVMTSRRDQSSGEPSPVDPIEYEIRNMTPQDGVKHVIEKRIMPITDLEIIFVSNPEEANVRIGFDANGGSWSLLGTDCLHSKEKTFNLGWLDAATIMHEFGHVLGLIHEHQNPEGKNIDWDLPKLYAWAKKTQGWDKEMVDTNIVQKYDKSQINGSKFDPKSIMLYFFPASLTKNNKGTDINQRLSPKDVVYIDKVYGGEETAQAFYRQVYGVSISADGNVSNKTVYIIVGIIAFILVAAGIYYFYSGKKKRGKKKK